MASIDYDLTSAWSSTNRYTAVGDVDVLISAVSGDTVVFEITDSDTVPDLPVDRGHQVWPRAPQPLQLKADDRLWLATPGADGVATLGVLTP